MEIEDDLRALKLEHVAIYFSAESVIKITSSTHFPWQFLVPGSALHQVLRMTKGRTHLDTDFLKLKWTREPEQQGRNKYRK